jgi:hypothetical protein
MTASGPVHRQRSGQAGSLRTRSHLPRARPGTSRGRALGISREENVAVSASRSRRWWEMAARRRSTAVSSMDRLT